MVQPPQHNITIRGQEGCTCAAKCTAVTRGAMQPCLAR